MKKIQLLMVSLAMLVFACEPMTDIHNEVDNAKDAPVGEIDLEMSDDDYALTGDENVENFKSFGSDDEAKELIPNVLDSKYPALGKGSLAKVTYNLYNPFRLGDTLDTHTVTDAEYTELGFTYKSFSSDKHIDGFLKWKYPEATYNKMVVDLTYNWYNGSSTGEVTKGMVYFDGTWYNPYILVQDDYDNLERVGKMYFSSEDEAEFKIGKYLALVLPYAVEGQEQAVEYNYDRDDMEPTALKYTFDGTSWAAKQSVAPNTISFGHDGTVWVPDNTIKYELTNADYELVGSGQYNNFDVRPGKDDETEEARIAKLNTILKNNFPNTEEGQKYLCVYNVYSGANEVWQTKVVLSGGDYIKFEE